MIKSTSFYGNSKWSRFSIGGLSWWGWCDWAYIGGVHDRMFSAQRWCRRRVIGIVDMGIIVAFMWLFFPCLSLFRFATKMQLALRTNDQETLNVSFENLKSCFKFMGIFTLIILAIYGLIFIFAMLGVVASMWATAPRKRFRCAADFVLIWWIVIIILQKCF